MIKEIKQEKTINEIAQDLFDKIPDEYNLCIKCDYESKDKYKLYFDHELFIFSIFIKDDDLDDVYNYIEDLYPYLINNFNFVPIKIKKYMEKCLPIPNSSDRFIHPFGYIEYYNIGYIKLTDIVRILYGGNIMKVEKKSYLGSLDHYSSYNIIFNKIECEKYSDFFDYYKEQEEQEK